MIIHIEVKLHSTHGFSAEVPGVGGLLATGSSPDEAIARVKMLSFAWISDEMAFGRANPHTVTFSVNASLDVTKAVAEMQAGAANMPRVANGDDPNPVAPAGSPVVNLLNNPNVGFGETMPAHFPQDATVVEIPSVPDPASGQK